MNNLFMKLGTFGELLKFLWKRKLWWLIPIVVLIVLIGLFIIVTASTGIAPFLYPLI